MAKSKEGLALLSECLFRFCALGAWLPHPGSGLTAGWKCKVLWPARREALLVTSEIIFHKYLLALSINPGTAEVLNSFTGVKV